MTFCVFFDLGKPVEIMRTSIRTHRSSDISQIYAPPLQEPLNTTYYDV